MIKIRKFQARDSDAVFRLVENGFNEFVRKDCKENGVKEFFRAAHEMIYLKPAGHFVLVAEMNNTIVGMIDIRDFFHISLFFVDKHYQGRGAGRKLIEKGIEYCTRGKKDVQSIEVYSSPYAAGIYEKLGFKRESDVQEKNGIRFVELKKYLKAD